MSSRLLALALAATLAACSTSVGSAPDSAEAGRLAHAPAPPGWRQHDTDRPQPPRVEPATLVPAAPPSDAVVLIGADGSGLGNWRSDGGGAARWRTEDGALVVVPGTGGIQTAESFGDVQLHIEWRPAAEPDKSSQDRSNSGVFLAGGLYEVQVLDVWDNATYADGRAAAVYGQFPPLADATRPPDQWQSYDVFFRMPQFRDDGSLEAPARITVLHNGVLVQNNEVLPGTTTWMESLPYEPHGPGPIGLQDHGSPVRFRNLWVRRIPKRPAPPADYALPAPADLTEAETARLLGTYERDGGGQFVIERLGDGLGLSMPWRPGVLSLVPLSPTRLHLGSTAGVVEVELDDAGAVARIVLTMGGGTYGATPQ